MRILYSHRIQSRDGQSVHVEELVAAFRAGGHAVLVVGPPVYERNSFGAENRMLARLRRLAPGAALEAAELVYNLPSYQRLHRACRDFKPDLLYERYNLFYLAGAWLARRHRLPFHLEVNAPLADERTRFGDLRLRAAAHAAERFVWRSATRVLAVTEVLKQRIAAAGVDPQRIVVVPNGADPDRFAGLPRLPDPAGAVVIGFVGFVRPWHGLDALIDAMAGHAGGPRIELVIVGDGPACPALRAQAAARGLTDRVRFAGLVDHAEVPAQVAGFDVALQPSAVDYASPLKLFDYMAAARAIVAPDQPNIREVLEHGRTALLFPQGDHAAMWLAVLRLAADPALRDRLGAAARVEILRRDYTWAGNARRIVDWARADAAQRPPETVSTAPVT